jgi:hypothetical protein
VRSQTRRGLFHGHCQRMCEQRSWNRTLENSVTLCRVLTGNIIVGLKYSIGRVPMASCDFSTHEYSYDDTSNDFNLTQFALTAEDLNYKVEHGTTKIK